MEFQRNLSIDFTNLSSLLIPLNDNASISRAPIGKNEPIKIDAALNRSGVSDIPNAMAAPKSATLKTRPTYTSFC